jgi:hypothetical protein
MPNLFTLAGMSPVPRRIGLLTVVVLAVAGVLFAMSRHVAPSSTPTSSPVTTSSPNHSVRAEVRTSSSGVPELWLVGPDEMSMKVSRLESGEGVRDTFAWSPHGELLAFEAYDLEGHSPLTTSHVWVLRRDGSGLADVTLPPPNQRFSTRLDKWLDDNTLSIRATLMSGSDELYTFRYDTKQVLPARRSTQ